jgi:predicted HTH transcriptional regulator
LSPSRAAEENGLDTLQDATGTGGPQRRDLVVEIAALLNLEGGYILLGVDDKGTVLGLA